jgi:hypothetical protein
VIQRRILAIESATKPSYFVHRAAGRGIDYRDSILQPLGVRDQSIGRLSAGFGEIVRAPVRQGDDGDVVDFRERFKTGRFDIGVVQVSGLAV